MCYHTILLTYNINGYDELFDTIQSLNFFFLSEQDLGVCLVNLLSFYFDLCIS